MSSLGELLRQRREEHRWSLDEVSQRTRIRRDYLVALEEGNYDALPADVQVRGFLRNYAHALGLSDQEALELYTHERGDPELVSIAPLLPPPRARSFVLPSLPFAILATIVTAALGYWLIFVWLKPVNPLPTPTLPPATPTNLLATATPTVRVVVGEPTAGPVAGTPTPKTYAGFEAVLTATANCWLRVVADGRVVYEGTLRAGTTRTFTAQQRLLVRMGNAGGVRITLNGKDLGVQGRPGQVLTRVWPEQ